MEAHWLTGIWGWRAVLFTFLFTERTITLQKTQNVGSFLFFFTFLKLLLGCWMLVSTLNNINSTLFSHRGFSFVCSTNRLASCIKVLVYVICMFAAHCIFLRTLLPVNLADESRNGNMSPVKMAAKLKKKRKTMTTVQDQYLTFAFATFPDPLHFTLVTTF